MNIINLERTCKYLHVKATTLKASLVTANKQTLLSQAKLVTDIAVNKYMNNVSYSK